MLDICLAILLVACLFGVALGISALAIELTMHMYDEQDKKNNNGTNTTNF